MKRGVNLLLAVVLMMGFVMSTVTAFADGDNKKCVMMKDGKMVVKEDGKIKPMTTDMTMEDGTLVKTNGTVVMKDGTSRTLAEGEKVFMDGRIKMKDKDMKNKEMNGKDKKDKDNK